jgi:general secretion pathway protein D
MQSIFQPKRVSKKSAIEKTVRFVADARTNTIIILGSEDDIARIKALIQMLDKETPRGKGKVHVLYLENATAEDLAKVLQELITKKAATSEKGKRPAIGSENIKITADKATNSLIIMAEQDDFKVLEQIVKKLDITRSMVFIECLIMEVNVNKNFSLGMDWQVLGEGHYENRDGVAGGGYSGKSYLTLDGFTGPESINLPAGASIGLFSEAVEIAGVTFNNIAAIIEAYKKDKDVHIISTPQILTTDNQEPKISVGKNVPFQTTAPTRDNDTYNSFEYRDVGTTLTITPQISRGRFVRLKIAQEVTKLETQIGDVRPTTLKRTIETTVIVKDRSTIVIGGLIDDNVTRTEYKVPFLSDLPLLGWLFYSEGKSTDKTNLFVFITPKVVNTTQEAHTLYKQKKDQLDKIIGGEIPLY